MKNQKSDWTDIGAWAKGIREMAKADPTSKLGAQIRAQDEADRVQRDVEDYFQQRKDEIDGGEETEDEARDDEGDPDTGD